MRIRWYRAYIGTVTDPKLMEAAAIAQMPVSRIAGLWHLLLESAADHAADAPPDEHGIFTLTTSRIAAACHEPAQEIERVLAAFEAVGLTAADRVVAWNKRQYAIEPERAGDDRPPAKRAKTNAERQRAWRERQREAAAKDGEKTQAPDEPLCITPDITPDEPLCITPDITFFPLRESLFITPNITPSPLYETPISHWNVTIPETKITEITSVTPPDSDSESEKEGTETQITGPSFSDVVLATPREAASVAAPPASSSATIAPQPENVAPVAPPVAPPVASGAPSRSDGGAPGRRPKPGPNRLTARLPVYGKRPERPDGSMRFILEDGSETWCHPWNEPDRWQQLRDAEDARFERRDNAGKADAAGGGAKPAPRTGPFYGKRPERPDGSMRFILEDGSETWCHPYKESDRWFALRKAEDERANRWEKEVAARRGKIPQ